MWAQFKQIMSEQKMFTKAITGFSLCKEVLPCVQYHPLVLLLALLGLWQLLIPTPILHIQSAKYITYPPSCAKYQWLYSTLSMYRIDYTHEHITSEYVINPRHCSGVTYAYYLCCITILLSLEWIMSVYHSPNRMGLTFCGSCTPSSTDENYNTVWFSSQASQPSWLYLFFSPKLMNIKMQRNSLPRCSS